MVTRIVTALVAIPIGILIIALNNEVLYYVAMTAFSVIAVYEMLVTTKYLKNKFTSAANIRLTADVNLFFRYLVVTNISYTAMTEKAVIAT